MSKHLHERQIVVIIKEPGMPARIEPFFDNTLESFQRTVGGYIESVTILKDLVIICNEEGRLRGFPHNVSIFGYDFVGTIILVGKKEDYFCSIGPGFSLDGIADMLNRRAEDGKQKYQDDRLH